MNEMDLDTALAATTQAVRGAWSHWGAVDERVIADVNRPEETGEPQWPGSWRAHTITRRGRSVLLASDGLAAPASHPDAAPSNGYGIEVYGISADPFDNTDPAGLAGGWLGVVVMSTSRLVAQHGFGFTDALARNRLMTVGIPQAWLPSHRGPDFIDDNGSMTVLLGLTDPVVPAGADGPLSPIQLVNIKLLTRAEAKFCVDAGAESGRAREDLERRFAEQGWRLYSSLDRPSVVLIGCRRLGGLAIGSVAVFDSQTHLLVELMRGAG